MNNQQVAHAWWKGEKKQGKGSNFFFEGDTIFSYGRQYPVARKIVRDGRLYVLFNPAGSSVSTARHRNYTRNAIDTHVCTILDVHPYEENSEFQNFKRFQESAETRLYSSVKARSEHMAAMHARGLENELSQAREYALFIGRPLPEIFTRLENDRENVVRELAEKRKAENAAAKQARAEREAQREEYERAQGIIRQARVDAWRQKLPNAQAPGRGRFGYFLRINGAHVETSGGVRIPVSLARRLLPLALASLDGKADAAAWEARGVKDIAGFPIHKVGPDSWRIGCHDIQASELRHIADELQKA